MPHHSRHVAAVNSRELRRFRLARRWTQQELARAAGYTERLVSKAENGGRLDIATIQDLAEALSTPEQIVTAESLTLDIASIARRWVETFERLETQMLPEIQPYLADNFEFICPGDPAVLPFVGIWKGAAGHQQWLDLFFGFFQRTKNQEVEYTLGDNSVIARWLERVTLNGVPCDPVRINMHFRFENGLIARIEDDYDTLGGAHIVRQIENQRVPPAPPEQKL